MVEPSPSYPFSHEFQPEEDKRSLSSSSKELYAQKKGDLPVDESEEFNDPYSDLSLFLSKKIKNELDLYGSIKNWSSKIQTDLLKKILPEFKKTFPKYRLGANALKKMWEKVNYYYGKVQSEDGAVSKNGKLDIYYLIRENLRKQKTRELPSHIPPYTSAHTIAVKLSECIATLDGVRPNIDLLTRTIWAAQKHLLPGISALTAKSPYEEYDLTDKVIAKCMLELTAQNPSLHPEELTQNILEIMKEYARIQTLNEKGTLKSHLSAVLAKELQEFSKLVRYLPASELTKIDSFIEREISILSLYKDFSIDAKRAEAVSRILALYPLANALPKTISQQELKTAIDYMWKLNTEECDEAPPEINESLLVFLNSELHLYQDKQAGAIPQDLFDDLVSSVKLATNLPQIPHHALKELEVYVWVSLDKTLQILAKTPVDILEILHAEIGNILIDKPTQSFQGIVNETALFLKKMIEIVRLDAKGWEGISHKAYIWSLQQDLVCKFIHLDTSTPLYTALQASMETHHGKSHSAIIDAAVSIILEQRRSLIPFTAVLRLRLTTLYKFAWYALDKSDTTYMRFLDYWKTALLAENKKMKEEELNTALRLLSEKLLPLFPFPEKH